MGDTSFPYRMATPHLGSLVERLMTVTYGFWQAVEIRAGIDPKKCAVTIKGPSGIKHPSYESVQSLFPNPELR